MATVTAAPAQDQWVVIPTTWETYRALLEERGEKCRPKYTYVDGRLTAVSPGHSHEEVRKRIAGMIEDILVGLMIDAHASGQVTLLKDSRSRAGNEADESYYLTNIERVRGKKDLVMGVDPPPDLVVEVVFSNPEDDALEAYRRLGVREVWVCKGAELLFLTASPEGRFERSPVSSVLPFVLADELAEWLYRSEYPSDTRLRHAFRTWVAETLAPRRQGDGI
jgi:Uma2 family endonuclease